MTIPTPLKCILVNPAILDLVVRRYPPPSSKVCLLTEMKALVFCREVLSEVLMLAAVQEHVQSAAFVLHQVRRTLIDVGAVGTPPVSTSLWSLCTVDLRLGLHAAPCQMFTPLAGPFNCELCLLCTASVAPYPASDSSAQYARCRCSCV